MSDSSAPLALLKQLAGGNGPVGSSSRAEDAWLGQGLCRGQLHEVYALLPDDGATAAGFAVALAVTAGAMPLLWLRTEADERRSGKLHVMGLGDLGLCADTLVMAVVRDEPALLRAAGDAARCPGLGTVLIESAGAARGLDLTATRRLMLAAEISGVTVLSVRSDARPVPSAAASRWGVAAAASTPLAAQAPGAPAFDVEMLRRRDGPAGRRWRVEWSRDEQAFREAPLPGAGVPLAPGRAAAGHAPAPVRRAG